MPLAILCPLPKVKLYLRLLVFRSLVQTLLSSSYQAYGIGSLDKDADEIHLLAKHLKHSFHSEVFLPSYRELRCLACVIINLEFPGSLACGK